MALSKTVVEDKIEVLTLGRLQIRTKTTVLEDSVALSSGFSRTTINPCTHISGSWADTDVSGYHLKEVEVLQHGTQYRAFVLLEYSDAEARKILTNRLRKDRMLFDKIRVTKAWRELDENANKQKQDDDDRIKRKLSTLNSQSSQGT